MDDKQKLNPSLLRLGIRRAVASPKIQSTKPSKCTPSVGDWTNRGTVSQAHHQNQLGRIMVKNEPWSPSSEPTAYLQNQESAAKDWVPTKPPKNKYQTHYSSRDQEPAMVPFSPPNPCSKAMVNLNQVKFLPQPSGIPKMPRSALKRKAGEGPQARPDQSPPPSTSSTAKKSVDKLLCEICDRSCSGPLSMQQHLTGRPHRAKLEYMQMKIGPKGKPRCDICGIWCSDWAGLEMHFMGRKHKAQVQEMELRKNNAGLKMSKTPIMCELCLVPCMNEDLYRMHLKGRQHATKQELTSRGML